ncbi:hypothetical protein KFL_000170260 [Klebsormidium nitens]|uniref:Uncharacterized protein n=1 Tax=Klebsormidium nitens TaxID=105231 RepID=A0A1Y1HJG9_KLENI|nr:hypothetical protein KFL_000170260 [Klebsormidium nitens]|eukprot:GAQ78680.1 hypothetical protein KFL_000170260 [Klebsormidium nitens]
MDKFVVTFCHNCDGGMQEFNTAKESILSVFPDAEVEADRRDEYPIWVSIKKGVSGQLVWEGDQRKLFRKYASDRSTSVQQIVSRLEQLKQVKL